MHLANRKGRNRGRAVTGYQLRICKRRDHMKLRASGRRNRPRRCRADSIDKIETLTGELRSDSLSDHEHKAGEKQKRRRHVPEDPSDSDYSEFEASKPEKSGRKESDSSDFEEDEVMPASTKKSAELRNPSQRKRARKNHAEGNRSTCDTGNIDSLKLSAKQSALLDEIFSEFDIHKNGRITLSDVLRVANDHGFDYSTEEARDMVRFWDTSGTITVSRETFRRLVVEAKFMVPCAK